ncbi:hypothetical protein NZD88_05035 [Chryseobacterium antibioticum]|uniref:Uncharacterized protein n=1 Tax=Chryseobacterium pyrolae TaxID=2987481 RepID=A0ABT2IE46_9FLAO|nr:hypothetical protein [Chryseobacterium pyrolae]MCT2406916.1 hypothetical protein [Chryseobacterium pyrolae]
MKKLFLYWLHFFFSIPVKKMKNQAWIRKTMLRKKKRFLFEKTSPDDVIRKAYDSVHE